MLKKTLISLALSAMWLSACKNDSKSPADTSMVAPSPQLDLIAVGNTINQSSDEVEKMKQFLSELDALPQEVKTKHEETISNIKSEVNDIIGRETEMILELQSFTQPKNVQDGQLNATTSSTDAGSDPAMQIATYNEYAKDMKALHEHVQKIKEDVKKLR